MSLFITSLNSGSNGNCYYIGNSREAVLIDVGITCRETEKRMKQLGLPMNKVKAIFVSHEHGDHIKGVSTLANKYGLQVYITPATAKNGPILIKHLSKPFKANQPIPVGELIVTPFIKLHDANDPHSFIVSYNGVTVGVFTDIGIPCQQVIHYFKQCHAAFLEANYDDELLENSKYPVHLKNRIKGNHGHLSNAQALELYKVHKPPFMTHLLLSHLSKENNSPQLAAQLFKKHAGSTAIYIASRDMPSEILCVSGNQAYRESEPDILQKTVQLELFD
jgi:phosphoribosyl 1,2-cyclic phosphodiesterase